jgi:hypothetical protein
MAEWTPIRTNPPVSPSRWDHLSDAIEIATYLILEAGSGTSSIHQRSLVFLKVSSSLPFLNAEYISDLVDCLHPIFVAKAERAVAVSEHTVAQRLLDPRDHFRLGINYLDDSAAYTYYHNPSVSTYLDDPTLF